MKVEMVNTDAGRIICEVDVFYYLLSDLTCICGNNETTNAFKADLISKLDTILNDDNRSDKGRLKSIKELKSEIHAFQNSDEGQRLQRNIVRGRTVLNNPNYKPEVKPNNGIKNFRMFF